MDSGLKGKLVVITGGARGLGYASATKFAKEGAEIVLADINGEMNNGDSLGHYTAIYTNASGPTRITARHGNTSVNTLMVGGNVRSVPFLLLSDINYTDKHQPWNVYLKKNVIPLP